MKKNITIQIHDYDKCGIYRIVEERVVDAMELFRLETEARLSVKVAWNRLPEQARHIVYYAEMLNEKMDICFAAIYMKGEAYADAEFERIFWQSNIGRVGAYHKR